MIDDEISGDALSDEEFDQRRASQPRTVKPPRCSKCDHIVKPFYTVCPQCQGDKNRVQVDRLAAVIRELKDSVNCDMDPERERELLKVYDHPDIKGLLNWLSDARDGKTKPAKREWKGRR